MTSVPTNGTDLMLSRRSQDAAPSQLHHYSDFDRLTFTLCMVMIAVTVGVLADYGPAAALRHMQDIRRNVPVLPTTEADLYSLSAMPF